MNILIANDHGGISMKMEIRRYLLRLGHSVENLGTDEEASCDYPDIAQKACGVFLQAEGSAKQFDFGILICGTGIGISISANKIDGIRCALIHDRFTAQMAREHNNANFIALGGRVQYTDSIEEIIQAFISSRPESGRHAARREKIRAIEQGRQ